MQFDTILYEKKGHVVTVTLNRPTRMNSISYELAVDLENAMKAINEDDDVRVMVLTGAGRAFCAGADLGYPEIKKGEASGILEDPKLAIIDMKKGRMFYILDRIVYGLTRLYKPVIASVNGVVVGAGFDICTACDIRIASTEAKFTTGFVRIGASQGVGGTWLLPRQIGLNRALQYFYTGEFFDGEEAYRLGYANMVVAPDKLQETTTELAERIAAGPPIAIRLQKQQVYRALESTYEGALQFSTAVEFVTYVTEDLQEGIAAMAAKRPGVFKNK